MDTTETSPCKLVISRDRLEASLEFDPSYDPAAIGREDMVRVLTEGKIHFTPGLEKRVDKLASIIKTGKVPPGPVLIAKGRPADPGGNGRFELSPELGSAGGEAEGEDPERINFYENHRIITVAEGEVIGKVFPPSPAQVGQDVYGLPIKPKAKRVEISLGKNVYLDSDGTTVRAKCDGRVLQKSFDLDVHEVLEVAGNVDFASGNIDSASDVLVRGSVLDLFSVKSRKSIEVTGNVDAATVEAQVDILVRGGICGKEKGKVICQGELRAKFCDSSEIHCDGNIHVAKEVINCDIRTEQSLFVVSGSLIGGRTHARNGGEIKVLGSDAGVRTHIGIGMDPTIFTSMKGIDEKVKSLRETAEKIRTAVKPLLDSLRRLTPDQREKATELVFQADDLEAQAISLEEEKVKLIQSATPVEGASLLITGRVCEGVSITVDNYSLRFEKELKGPVRIEKRKVKNVTEIVGVNQISGSIQVFPARKIDLPDLREEA
ncbi:MAG: DUF342 domain-containing protein [Phycisphaerae bacterium]|nr:DUF342 domain-containing protein [Phycisphaerae bacterium]